MNQNSHRSSIRFETTQKILRKLLVCIQHDLPDEECDENKETYSNLGENSRVKLCKNICLFAHNLLVEGLGVGGGGRDVGVTGGLVGAGGELELVGRLQVGIAGGAVGGGVILEVEKKGEHFVFV